MRAGRSYLAVLLGQGIATSLTPEMHEREASRQHLRYVYKIADLTDPQVRPAHLAGLLAAARDFGANGMNVTHPVKQTMVPLVDRVTAEVAAIGALNTVLFTAEGTVGHNTDVTGFGRAFDEGLVGAPRDEVVLLGAGGAGTAVAHALTSRRIGRLVVVDPDADRAAALRDSLARTSRPTDVVLREPGHLAEVLATADGLVNATPIGMAAHPGSPVPGTLLRPEMWVADIVYRPLHTDLLRAAADRGCRTLTGAGMAVHQAADAFELITGRPADRPAMFRDFEQLVVAEALHDPTSRDHPA